MNKQTRKTLFGSAKDDWSTPQWLFDLLDPEFEFGLDAAAQEDETDAEYALRQAARRLDLVERFTQNNPTWESNPVLVGDLEAAVAGLPRRKANWKCPNFLTEKDSAFDANWLEESEHRAAFLNPPYGRGIGNWMALAKRWGQVMTVVTLVPARTDTRWFWDHALDGAQQIRLLRGRLQFGGGVEATAPFPSAVVIYRPRPTGLAARHAEIVGWDPPRPKGATAEDVE